MQAARGVVGEVGAGMREPPTLKHDGGGGGGQLEELGCFAEITRRKSKHRAHC